MMSRVMTSNLHRILPIRLYFTVAGALLVFTGITVLVAQIDLGAWNLLVAMLIAAVKASLVALYFMHLRYDHKFFALIFLIAVGTLAAFIILTMFDTMERGAVDPAEAAVISKYAVIYDAKGTPIPMKDRVFTTSAGSTGPEEVPFEIKHGFGPIKEEVKVGPLDTAMALRGQKIFQTKCATCHKLDERYTGPPLRGVTVYRSATFIMNQILDPAQNVSKHPDMQALLRQYYTMMTNQNVTVEDARALVEYLRWEATRGGQ
jgi:caa(3)-type oxidase subunit IV